MYCDCHVLFPQIFGLDVPCVCKQGFAMDVILGLNICTAEDGVGREILGGKKAEICIHVLL